jgi:predicted nucleotidyltransferase component of viral defense system
MGQTLLTPHQHDVLEFVSKELNLTKHYYLTGGTALTEFYLHHRLSEDLDFFTETEEVNPLTIEAFISTLSKKLQVKKIDRSQFCGLFSYYLTFSDGQVLKLDFNYYPFPRIEKGKKYHQLTIDSLEDIAANKVHTIFMKPRSRDYVDLYFIMQNTAFSLPQIIKNAKAKFDWHIDSMTLASQLMRVKDLHDIPKIIIPYNQGSIEKYIINLATELKPEIIK